MIFDNFDAALPAATPMLLPIAGASEALEMGSGPTLDDALREFESVDRAPDLWVTDGMRGTASPVTVELASDNGSVSAEPSDEDATNANPQADGNAPQDHPLIKEKLSLAKIGHALGGRQFDSTDYYFEEMSTADWVWAEKNFQADVYAAVRQFTAGATSQPEADQMAQAYLNSIGLGGSVHVGPAPQPDDAIVVTAQIYHHPTNYMPPLWTDHDLLGSLDPNTIYDVLDVSAHTIAIDMQRPLTELELAAVEKLRLQIELTTAMLNSLPANGIFTFPDGRTITVAELRALWARADFVITDKDYSGLGTASRPGAGAAHRNDGDPLFEVNIERLTNVFMPMDWSRTLYPLHELAHVTLAGYATTVAMWADGGASDPEHDMNEAFATSLGIAIGQVAGYSWLPLFLSDGPPGEALPLVPLPTFTAPAGGDGGGTGGPGGGGGGDVGEQ